MNSFEFLYPYLIILLPLPLLIVKFWPRSSINDEAVFVPFFLRLVKVSKNSKIKLASDASPSRKPFQKSVLAISWLLLVACLMRPVNFGAEILETFTTRDIMVSIDISQSMEKKDFTLLETNKQVQRLDVVKEIAKEFGEKRRGDRLGLIVFGESAYLQTPFTEDVSLWGKLVQELHTKTAGMGTAIGDSIGLSIRVFEETEAVHKTLVLITDGDDTQSYLTPVEAAKIAAVKGIRVFTVAVGDPSSTRDNDKADTAMLKKIAEITNGKSYIASDFSQLKQIFVDLDSIAKAQVTQKTVRPQKDLYPILVVVILLIQLVLLAVETASSGGDK